MKNFHIQFSYPWLLLLLIPAIVLTLLPYFRLSKRYRKTRNRITSIVLHLIIMVLAIGALSGMKFHYQIPNEENEIILLVDVSDTEEQSQKKRDQFVKDVLNYGSFDGYKMGVVTFGFDQEYAVPLTTSVDGIYDKYIKATLPDTSATNIAAALTYTKNLFNNPETSKIVLITDGKETDETAAAVISSVSAQGTKVDVAHIDSMYAGDDVQLVGVTLPDSHINVGVEYTIGLAVQSNYAAEATIVLSDNGVVDTETGQQDVNLVAGTQTINFKHTFAVENAETLKKKGELHELGFKIKINGDLLGENNEYVSYVYIEVFNNILIIQHADGESDGIKKLLGEDTYNFTVSTIGAEGLPASVDDLRKYDQVILNNISNKELKSIPTNDPDKTFDMVLESYVSELGGGLFTVGGNDSKGAANAYNRKDMYGSLYQQMLPVQAIEYTPPVGVVVIIDRSGSMGTADEFGDSNLTWARRGATACLDALTERDYIGIMTLDSSHDWILPLTPRTQDAMIREAINKVEDVDGGTVFTDAIDRAGKALHNLTAVDKRHIIIVSDCQVGEEEVENFKPLIKEYYDKDGTTLSIIGVGLSKSDPQYSVMKEAAETLGHGRLIITNNPQQLVTIMMEELNEPVMEEVNYTTFNPIIYDSFSQLVQNLKRALDEEGNVVEHKLSMTLDGFYGVKVKNPDYLVLTGEYQVPLYAQWKYGNGMVGSFMCDLNGTWSADFLVDENAQKLMRNIVDNLMPTEDIAPSEITFTLSEDNYTNKLGVFTTLQEGEYVKGEIVNTANKTVLPLSLNAVTGGSNAEKRTLDCYVTLPLSSANHYSRCDFVVKGNGVYKITLIKCAADGTEIARLETFKSFSYSEEYDTNLETTNIPEGKKLALIAELGKGSMLEDAHKVFEGFETGINRTFDPRFLFMILALVLFLTDIAVRKFKFKWPHELVRAWKEKKEQKQEEQKNKK